MIEFQNFNNDYLSYQFLINFYHQNKDKFLEPIDISFKKVNWFAGNSCSIVGAILEKLKNNLNEIRLLNLKPNQLDILQRNDFLSFFGFEKKEDYNYTTIKYLKLQPKDSRYFNEYVTNELLDREVMPQMSSALKKKIMEGIHEIFANAKMHSETKEGIFTCGQFFPNKHQIEFMITDLGIGIKNRINMDEGTSYNAVEAINWAMEGTNTTKKTVPGGLGLKILKEFISLNKGKIQVISNDGYWNYSDGRVFKKLFDGEFPGTAINLCFNTEDQAHYSLTGELKDEDIF